MREVEELEKLTKDFIKDMDKKGPVITSAPTGIPDLKLLKFVTSLFLYSKLLWQMNHWLITSVSIQSVFMHWIVMILVCSLHLLIIYKHDFI